MMKLPAFVSVFSLTFFAALASSSAFIARELSSSRSMRTIGFEKIPVVLQATAQDTNGLTPQEINVYELLKELSDSKLPFRIVVVGNGAILESTNTLGPTFKLGKSPKSGASIVTFASEDQSFEFHLMPAQIASAVLVEKPSPTKEGKTMRLLRFRNGEGGSICSLILADDSSQAASWYQSMAAKHGSEVEF
jgi:hypothetical protein